MATIAPPALLTAGAAAAVLAALPGARAVGGAVRDALAGLPVADIDIAAPFPPEAITERLRAAGLAVHPTGLAHGTVTAVLAGTPVEVTSLRRDLETDGRHALVAWTTDWREDAARRDFTINAMSMAADGRLWDYFDGRADLAAGRFRFVGDAAIRLREDRLRALRFFRFQARYGIGQPDPAAIAAITASVPDLTRLSAERVWMELKRLLAAPAPAAAVGLMAATGVLAAVLPEASDRAALVALGAPPDPLLRVAALLGPGAATSALAARLRLSGEEAARLADLVQAPGWPTATPADAALRRHLAEHGAPLATDQAWLAAARGEPGDWGGLRARIGTTPVPSFPLAGRDALALGMPPGPAVGALLATLRQWWLDRGCVDDRAACLAALAGALPPAEPTR